MLAFKPLKSYISQPQILKQQIPSNLRLLAFNQPNAFDKKLMASVESHSAFWEAQNLKFHTSHKTFQQFHDENRDIYLAYNKRVWLETGELIYEGMISDLGAIKRCMHYNFTVLVGRIRVLILLSFGAGLGLPFLLLK